MMENMEVVLVPEELKPIGIWGYLAFIIIFSIPMIGFVTSIMLAVFSKNKNVKNLAIARIIVSIFIICLGAILVGTSFFR